MRTLLLAFLSLLFLSACQTGKKEVSEIIQTQNGTIEGYSLPDKGLHIYKGIPFAQAPVGELRWKAPQPVEDWAGVKQCKEFSAIAMQGEPRPFSMWTSEFIAPAENMSEDCLYLNIWTPAKTIEDKLPVLVFIHGGGFSSGSGSVPLYDGEAMAQRGVVFITINYRVGVFGFFSHPELTAQSPVHASGNQGLLDQVEALKWINENIEAFGGNPENVTIAGQSAGAFSVGYLKASPLCKGLIHKAIAESGGASMPVGRLSGIVNLQEAEQQGLKLQELMGVNSLSELQDVDAKIVMKHYIRTGPIVDGYFLPKSVYEIYMAGEQNNIPLISGWNEDEGFGGPPKSAAEFIAFARENYGESAEDFLEVFPASTEEEAAESQSRLGVITTFGIQTFNWILLQNEKGTKDVYAYYFRRDVPYGEGQTDFGAFHSGELGYAYDNLEQSKVRPWTDTDRKLADQMSAYWVNFARTGNPNGEGLPEWESCIAEDYKAMIFDEEAEAGVVPDLDKLSFLRKFFLE